MPLYVRSYHYVLFIRRYKIQVCASQHVYGSMKHFERNDKVNNASQIEYIEYNDKAQNLFRHNFLAMKLTAFFISRGIINM